MGQVAGGRRGRWRKGNVWVGIYSVDLQRVASPVVSLDEEGHTVVWGAVKGRGQSARTHKVFLPVIFDPFWIRMTPQTYWTSPHSRAPASLQPVLVLSHPARPPVTAGLHRSPSGALKERVRGWRLRHRHTAPHRDLRIAIAAWPKHLPPLLPIPNPPLHPSYTHLAPHIRPLMATTPLPTPALLLQLHRGHQTAAIHTALLKVVVKAWPLIRQDFLATRQQPSEATGDILQEAIPPWRGGIQLDQHLLEEGTCPCPEAAPSAPLLQKVTSSSTPLSGAAGKWVCCQKNDSADKTTL